MSEDFHCSVCLSLGHLQVDRTGFLQRTLVNERMSAIWFSCLMLLCKEKLASSISSSAERVLVPTLTKWATGRYPEVRFRAYGGIVGSVSGVAS